MHAQTLAVKVMGLYDGIIHARGVTPTEAI